MDRPMQAMTIPICSTVADIRDRLAERRAKGSIALIPTMGALHAGHAELFREGRKRAGQVGTVVASIFINPTQFGPQEDFASYPRKITADAELCQSNGVDLLFAPGVDDIYARDRSLDVRELAISRGLCGATRPGHFPGVCLVVLKLFNIIQPNVAIFGKKDYQQLAVIRRMVRDLNIPVEIVGAETVREPDGLAMSSRNAYLNESERKVAPGIHAALLAGKALWEKNRESSVTVLMRFVRSRLEQIPGARVDYLEIADAENLESVTRISAPVVMAAAVYLGKARLIDNVEFGPPAT